MCCRLLCTQHPSFLLFFVSAVGTFLPRLWLWCQKGHRFWEKHIFPGARANVKAPLLHREGAHDGVQVQYFSWPSPARCLSEFRSAAGDQGLDNYLQIARINLVASFGDEEVQLDRYLFELLSDFSDLALA